MTPKVIDVLGDEPVSLEEARAHIEAPSYGDSDVDPVDDAMIDAWIEAAREHCENFLGVSLKTKVLEIALDSFPTNKTPGGKGVVLPVGPVREVVSASWGDDSDAELDADDYVLDNYSHPSRLCPVGSWPAVTEATNAIKIRYLAGYGVDSDGGEEVPKAVRAAILLIVGHFYKNREDSTESAMSTIPNGAEALMRPLRVRLGMA